MSLLRHAETKVLLVLVLALVVLEGGARMFETKLSKDVSHIRSLPAVAAELKAAPANQLKVLILGNSLSRDGLDKALLKTGLEKLTGRPVHLAAMHPDASNIGQWFYGYRRYFAQTGAHPDLVILGTGRPHLLDGRSEPDRQAAFYTSLKDMPLLLKEQQGDVEAISKALVARASMLFAHRARVEPLLFYNGIPGYTETTQTLSVHREHVTPASEGETADAHHEAAPTCHLFESLLKTFQAGKTRVIVVAIPMTETYELPECVEKAVKQAQMSVVDTGASLQYPPERFPDGYHLDKTGAAQFTSQLLEVLGQRPEYLPNK
ncbi:hypothetical protein SAMN02745166_03622 [Prosthecobacter debontii]|uniref:SGNH/GDSL hydrolase family protein n=1 Tax=Prosthecobacter debontii TaxID=48467 RepID=A0A1T4YKN7_9BACT|nr:hypothetical protein [Prosthecobacter debontii]SKB02316.1 hypothetical protein SAMN02745166_03622 [Prosthecobacter debontii]